MAATIAGLSRAQPCCRLTDLDQVTVRVTDVGAYLVGMVLWLGEELGASGGPLRVGGGDVRDPEVEERAVTGARVGSPGAGLVADAILDLVS